MSLKPRRAEATFEVSNKGQLEQWPSNRIEKALGVSAQDVSAWAKSGRVFEVGADGALRAVIDEEMHKRFKLSGCDAAAEK